MVGMRLMFIHAHPDDESSKGAATCAKYAAEGHRVRIVTCTGGERGAVLNPRLQGDPAIEQDLPAIRRVEMARSAAALGVEHVWLGFVDSGLPQGDPLPPLPEGCFAAQPLEVTAAALAAQLTEFRPHVVVTYNERGGYPHPDHIMVHRATMAALARAAGPDVVGRWDVPKVYYDVSFSRAQIVALDEAIRAAGLVSPFEGWLARHDDDAPARRVTARVDVAQYFPQRDAALRAHATQIDPDGFFFAAPRDLEARAWPWEEYELAYSRVPVPDCEDSLLTGLAEAIADGRIEA